MLGEKIYNLRKSKKISQEDFALMFNTSRQAVSKWERNEAKPDIDKLIAIAKLFNVSIDYLLSHEINDISIDSFINELKDCLLNNEFTVSIDDIKLWCSKYNNNFKLHIHSADYLYVAFFNNCNEEYLDLALSFINKAIALFNPEYNEMISLNDLYMGVAQIYLIQKKYDLAQEYVKKHNVYGCELLLAKCDLSLKNYDNAFELASEIYLNSTSNIINASYIQIIVLLKNKKIQEAFDLVNWTISFVNSINNNEEFFGGIIYPFIYLKAVSEKLMHIDNKETIEELKNIYANSMRMSTTAELHSVKHYYGQAQTVLLSDSNIKHALKEIINQTSKKDVHYQSLIEIYNEIFGGDIND